MTTATSASIASTSPAPCTTYPYIYAIIRTDDRLIFDIAGIDGAEDVYTVGAAGLSAVISDVGASSFQGMSRDLALRRLGAHQQVAEAVMRDYPVLPVKFGTILPDQASVRGMLTQGAAPLAAALDQLAGARQTEVVLLWELPKVFAAIGAEPEIAALKAQIASRSTEATFEERVAFGQAVQAGLSRHRAALREQVIAQLGDLARDLVINPTMDDGMAVNLALLIDQAHAGELDQRLQQLDAALGGQYQIRCVGPLPPYSFATAAAQAFTFDTIDAARRRLGLGGAATAGEIKHAYRTLAALAHPDHSVRGGDAEEHMAALTQAYKLLCQYADNQAMRQPGDNLPCRFDHDDVARTLLISISRQGDAQEPSQ